MEALKEARSKDAPGERKAPHPATPACPYCEKRCASPSALGDHLLSEHAPEQPAAPVPITGAFEHELLSAQEEKDLSRKILAGGPDGTAAKKRLVECNLRLVAMVARGYRGGEDTFDDLVQEGTIGLMRAAEKFEPDRGFRFSTYAMWWIKQAIRRASWDRARLVRIPPHVQELAARVRRLMRTGVPLEEAAEAAEADPDEAATALRRTAAREVSMEAGKEGLTLGASLASPEDEAADAPERPDIQRLLAFLDDRHRHVVVRRFGLDGRGAGTLDDVGRELGLSRERIRQLETRALRHLRENCLVPDGEGGIVLLKDATVIPEARTQRRLYDWLDPNRPPLDPPVQPKTPQPHQEEALDAVLQEFETADKATVVMACGTGKTLVGMWTFRRASGRAALVLAPSLFLLRQILREWRAHGAADRYLCVCSDKTVGDQDEVVLSAEELGAPVTTSAAEVRRWLEACPPEERILVLSTYHSARTLGAGLPAGFAFDLAVFDEAHRTTGERNRNFSFGLVDRQIAAKKRLFLTATPRGIAGDGSENPHFSMADPLTYGRHVYELGLSEAIARGIVCDYKVVIAVVTKAEVASFFSGPGHVRAKGESLSLREAAYQVAFARAVQESGAAKVITFHGAVSSADRFARSRWLREDLLPQGFETYHVNGRMPTGLRQAVMSRFEVGRAALVTNARCLNEGVDVPAVDMVAFMSPKRSRTDIVQAIGRALRKSPGKDVGYIMLPVLVDDAGNPIATAAEYRDLSEVIYSLRAQDAALDRRVRRGSFEKGAGASADGDAMAKKVAFFGPERMAETMMGAIAARVLAPTESSWDEMFGRLVAFKRSHGTCYVPPGHDDLQLSNWMAAQRRKRREKRLSERQVGLLESVGFPWAVKKDIWTGMVAALGQWKALHGHCDVPRREGRLGQFVNYVRQQWRRGKLSTGKVRELDAMGFRWQDDDYKPMADAWAERYRELKLFVENRGWKEFSRAPVSLRRWASNQRRRRKAGLFEQSRMALLDAISFPWEIRARRLIETRKTSREKRPVGTILVRRQHDNGRDVEERWIKVRDDGPSDKRWVPYARWWWEKNRGPVPPGKGVIHVNGNRMDDSPENLCVGGPGDRIRLAHLRDPKMSARNRKSCRAGTAEYNRKNGVMSRFRSMIEKYWYPVLERDRVILNCPFRRRSKLLAHFGADVSKIPKSGLGPEVDRAIEQAGVLPLQGLELKGKGYSDFLRIDPDLGLANPDSSGAAAYPGVLKRLEDTAVWRAAKKANALYLKDRK